MASWPADFALSGVGKSGSPAPKSMTSTPSRRNRSTVAVTFIVGELEMRLVRSANFIDLCTFRRENLFTQPGLDQLRHQTVHASAQREHFFDQSRADVGVLLRGHHEDRL